jgi:hypothetical protein
LLVVSRSAWRSFRACLRGGFGVEQPVKVVEAVAEVGALALYVLSGIKVDGTASITCTGGTTACVWPWTVEQAALTPTVYAYRVPRAE